MDAAAAHPLPRAAAAPRAGLAAWLTILLVALFCLNTAGGWVRLSGAGVAIPNWPLIELDGGRRTLLPPMDESGWLAAQGAWAEHQETLRAKIAAGEIHGMAVGRQPQSLGEFRTMFLTEWFHRLLAAVVVLVVLGCWVSVLRDPVLRRRVGVPVTAAVLLIASQAVLGAMLIGQGTSTRWLFLHQGNAALILASVLIAILRLLDGEVAPVTTGRPASRVMIATTVAAAIVAWIMLMLGGLLSASRHHLPSGGLLGLDAGPIWWPAYPVSVNLLDNASLHHVVHRLGAVIVAALTIAAVVLAHRRGAPERARLALSVAGTFVALQAILGISAAVMPEGEIAVPLAHLFLGHILFLSLVLAWRDARTMSVEPAPPSTAAVTA